jgi:UDPglucose 6-dehydrogenase
MNDIANLCEIVGADVNAVRKGIGSDSRIGKKFIYPGTGYGGSCFPKDVKALIKTADSYSYSMRVLKAVEEVNDDQKSILFNKLNKHFDYNLKGKHFALWGLSFKPQTDDMREAPSLVIIRKLREAGATVRAYDPVAMKEAKHILGDKIEYAEDKFEALENADGLIVVTEWPEFKFINFQQISQLLNNNLILDGRNIYDAKEMKENNFIYYCIGINTNK